MHDLDEQVGFWRWMRSGYDRRTVVALGLMAVTIAVVGVVYNHLIEWDEPMDWLLVGIWAAMAALLSWRVDPKKDLPLLFIAGAALGVFLEYWGTTRFCWTYYTREKPPFEAALAHGFATVAFARGVQGMFWVKRLLWRDGPP